MIENQYSTQNASSISKVNISAKPITSREEYYNQQTIEDNKIKKTTSIPNINSKAHKTTSSSNK